MTKEKDLTYTDFRKRIGDVKHPEYWRSLDEAMRSDVFDDFMHDEFPRQAAALKTTARLALILLLFLKASLHPQYILQESR